MNESWREVVKKTLQTKATEIAALFGAKISVSIGEGYPFLMNDIALTQKVKGVLTATLGEAKVQPLGLRMTAEDFAFYSHHRPVCFFRLGTGFAEKQSNPAVHHPEFDIDENALEVGVKCMLAIALS